MEYLASVGCDIFAQTSDGSTILHYSAVKGYSTCVKMILDSNFDPNVVLTTEEVCVKVLSKFIYVNQQNSSLSTVVPDNTNQHKNMTSHINTV